MQRKFPDENAKLTLDEAAFQRLLGAAYVIQEHNESVQSQLPDPSEFKAADLSEIAEVQNLIRARKLDLAAAASVVVERVRKIARAQAAAFALNAKSELTYLASSGEAAPTPQSTVPLDQSLSQDCIRSGHPSSLSNLKNVAGLQAKFFLGRGVQGFAALPVRNGQQIHRQQISGQQISGVLELYFTSAATTDPATLHACELLAGLLNGLSVSAAIPSKPSQNVPPLEPASSPTKSSASTSSASPSQAPVPTPPQIPASPLPPASVPAGTLTPSAFAPANAALDQLHAELDRLFDDEPESVPHPQPTSPASSVSPSAPVAPTSNPAKTRCAKCGCPFDGQEAFCGLCGTPREGAAVAPAVPLSPETSAMQLERTLRRMDLPQKEENLPQELKEIIARFPEETSTNRNEAQVKPNPPADATPVSGNATAPPPESNKAKALTASLTQQLVETQNQKDKNKNVDASTASQVQATQDLKLAAGDPVPPVIQGQSAESTENKSGQITTTTPRWKSASETRAWLESVKLESIKAAPPAKHWLVEHRSNLYLAASAILLILVLAGVGSPASDQHKGHLGWFDSMLVSMGIAEAPAAPVYVGNPNAQVWVDLHTALYYCSDADSYGKTSGGKFETQRQAQQDQFEPSSNHPCP